jgi:hypothetical protein
MTVPPSTQVSGPPTQSPGPASHFPLAPRCQYEHLPIGALPPLNLLRPARLVRERARLRRHGAPTPGTPSQFSVGDWVTVADEPEIRATLDETNRHKGLWFTDTQWSYCGRTFQVEHVVRVMMDDHYRMRRVHRTVTLSGGTCAGHTRDQGCGLDCALLFRDAWLRPATAPAAPDPAPVRYATVRTAEEIEQTLGKDGTLHGVPFHSAMRRLAGQRLPVTGPVQHRALPAWQYPVGEWYLLAGARCQGEPLGIIGCDRQCALLWHRSWLSFE